MSEERRRMSLEKMNAILKADFKHIPRGAVAVDRACFTRHSTKGVT